MIDKTGSRTSVALNLGLSGLIVICLIFIAGKLATDYIADQVTVRLQQEQSKQPPRIMYLDPNAIWSTLKSQRYTNVEIAEYIELTSRILVSEGYVVLTSAAVIGAPQESTAPMSSLSVLRARYEQLIKSNPQKWQPLETQVSMEDIPSEAAIKERLDQYLKMLRQRAESQDNEDFE